MVNPYEAPNQTSGKHQATFLPRFAAVVIYLALWGCVVFAIVKVLSGLIGEPQLNAIENRRNLTSLQSLYFYTRYYWFVALFFSVPINLVAWKVLRAFRKRSVRWELLLIAGLMIPVMIFATWLAVGFLVV
jgi:hypothetical protein